MLFISNILMHDLENEGKMFLWKIHPTNTQWCFVSLHKSTPSARCGTASKIVIWISKQIASTICTITSCLNRKCIGLIVLCLSEKWTLFDNVNLGGCCDVHCIFIYMLWLHIENQVYLHMFRWKVDKTQIKLVLIRYTRHRLVFSDPNARSAKNETHYRKKTKNKGMSELQGRYRPAQSTAGSHQTGYPSNTTRRHIYAILIQHHPDADAARQLKSTTPWNARRDNSTSTERSHHVPSA